MSAPNLQHTQAVMANNISEHTTPLLSKRTCSYPSLQGWPSALAQTYRPDAVLVGFLMACLLQFLVCLAGWYFKGLKPYSRRQMVRDASSAEKMENGEGEGCLQDEKAEGAQEEDNEKERRPKCKRISCYGRDEALSQIIVSTTTFAQFSSERFDECSTSLAFRFSTLLGFLAIGYALLKLLDHLHLDWFGRLPKALRADSDDHGDEDKTEFDSEE